MTQQDTGKASLWKVAAWDDGDCVVTYQGKPIGQPLSRKEAESVVRWLNNPSTENELLYYYLQASNKKSSPSEFYTDVRWCPNCNKDTEQRCRDSNHERDSTMDYQECLTCHWVRTGWTGEWEAPN